MDPLLSLFTIPIDDPLNINQDIAHLWQLIELGLMPEDEVHYHFELSDNDLISGPKKTVTKEFIARLPGLAELFTAFENEEEALLEDIYYSKEELEAIRENMEKLELDLLKQDKESAEKHDLFSSDLLKKFNQLQKLIDQLLSEDLLKNVQDMYESFKICMN